jgi:hypothetical protein
MINLKFLNLEDPHLERSKTPNDRSKTPTNKTNKSENVVYIAVDR